MDALLAEALDLEEGERSAWLAARTGADAELAGEVERLLELAARPIDRLLAPVREFAAAAEAPEGEALAPGDAIGAYTVVRRLGAGGMGVVYLAERTDGSFERRVALKVLPAHATSREAVRAFEQERRILARLDHPNIARLLDGGVDPRGLPYLVMELVEGEPIDAWCDARRLSLAARVRLVVAIAGAVQAAHRSLIVHRDLKPANVLVTALGEVKLLDFGVASLLDPDRPAGALTDAGRQPFTPTYASPEQVAGEPVTAASDVYQLGLLLYELATGCRPQGGRTSSLVELVERVCRAEPPPPSRAALDPAGELSASRRAAVRATTPKRLAAALRPELDAVVAQALVKEPARRYAAPAELAADLERWLEGRPVRARRASLLFRTRKWVRRNALAASVAGAVLVLTGGYAVAVNRERARAELEAAKASEVERFLVSLFEASDPEASLGQDVSARDLLARGAERVDEELAGQPAVQARIRSALGEIYGRLGLATEGRALVTRALEAQRALVGERSLDAAQSLQRLGVLLREAGEPQPAAAALERAVALRREVAPEDLAGLARALAELGGLRRELVDVEGAERSMRESLEIHRRRGSIGGIAVGLNNVGSILFWKGDLDGAERHYREALALQRRHEGERHPKVALALYNLASVELRRGHAASAVPLLDEALAIDRVAYGEQHLIVARDELRLATALQEAGELTRAETIYDELLPRCGAAFGERNPTTTNARVGLGRLRVQQGRHGEAEALLATAVEAITAQAGAGHYRVGLALLWLGRALAGQGRDAEAVAAWRAARAVLRPDLNRAAIAEVEAELAAAAGRAGIVAASGPGGG